MGGEIEGGSAANYASTDDDDVFYIRSGGHDGEPRVQFVGCPGEADVLQQFFRLSVSGFLGTAN